MRKSKKNITFYNICNKNRKRYKKGLRDYTQEGDIICQE
jgi:hypothetical protein